MRYAPALVALLAACSNQSEVPVVAQSAADQYAKPSTESEYRSRIASNVFDEYTQNDYPKLYKTVGGNDLTARIQRLREAAARRALDSGICDRVELADISQSSTRQMLSAFVDCSNRERFYVSERDIETSAVVVANSELVMPRGAAIIACSKAARSLATFPSLFDAKIWSGARYRSNTTSGGALVELDFTAVNALGISLPYKAECTFSRGAANPEVTVATR
ncbi:MAG: hypothetical protein ACK40R_00210 [Thermomonas sp.]